MIVTEALDINGNSYGWKCCAGVHLWTLKEDAEKCCSGKYVRVLDSVQFYPHYHASFIWLEIKNKMPAPVSNFPDVQQ